MSYLYSIFLPALAAAAIPLLLHFFSRQRLKVIEFSSLEFLLKLQKRQARRVQLRQIILLILRTLALLALVLAFARPALDNDSASGEGASSTETVIILNDAISSTAETRSGSVFQLELEYLDALVKTAGVNDRVTVLPLSEPTSPITRIGSESIRIPDELTDRTPFLANPSMSLAFTYADSIFRKSDRFNRELFIISPFYVDGIDTTLRSGFDKVRKYLVPVGPDYLPNIGIEKISLLSAIRQKGRPVEIAATIRNYGNKSVEALPISLYIGNEKVAQGSVDIASEGSAVRNFTFTISESGLLSGSIRLDDPDPLSADDRRHFILDVPEKLRLLAVANDSLELQILRSVFQAGPADFFDLTLRLARSWESDPLSGYDVLLLSDIPMLSAGAVQRVETFVQNGGGVILMPGSNSDLADWSRGILNRLGFKAITGVTTGGVKLGAFDRTHPLFSGVFEDAGSPSFPNLLFALNISPGTGDIGIVPLTNGGSFLIERQFGRGRALLFAAPPSPVSGEYIFSGIFAPLLFRSSAYSAGSRSGVENSWEVGTVQRPILSLSRAIELNMITPAGVSFFKQPRATLGGSEYDAGLVVVPGIYRFEDDGKEVAKYSANIAADIGSLSRVDIDEMADNLGGAEVLTVPAEQIAAAVKSARFGKELWLPFAAMFLGFLAAESIVSRFGQKKEP